MNLDKVASYNPNFELKGNIDLSLIEKASKKTFVPLIVGGGITNLSQVEKILKSGADRVFINTAGINNQKFIKKEN